ncbi:MAG: hypothetical protein Ct9H90mP16_13380 [Candidatus Poseidoniales archaeon]|nr:MAG: hypothetical protein Ct9H90mP16_13380 [Candidatus Poseidoniales archaeon]
MAWPTAELAVMGADGAVQIIHRRRIQAAGNPDEERQRLVESIRRDSPILTKQQPWATLTMSLNRVTHEIVW